MRVSELFGLTGTQGTFDFVDVHHDSDTALFIDPSVLANIDSEWAQSCVSGVQTYFQAVLDRIIANDRDGALGLLTYLGEENATHLGYSSRSRGSGVGRGLAARFYDELSTSAAVTSGLITDLEDTALLVEGVREDRISDVVTNVIRRQLAEYTQGVARYYGIPMQTGVAIAPYWEAAAKAWRQDTFELPVTPSGPLLLVPKAIVRRGLFMNPSEYYRHYILEYYRELELHKPASPLVYVLRSGVRKVNKSDVEKQVRRPHIDSGQGIEKRVNVDGTQANPRLLDAYKQDKSAKPPALIDPATIADVTNTAPPDFVALLAAVKALTPGTDDATAYEKAVEALLSALFYPSLANPVRQEKIHQGRKRIDISYSNVGRDGDFFHFLANSCPAGTIAVECKNYSRPLANPEFDQIAGRFSPSRGKYGLLVYRSIEDKARVLETCRDTAHDDRGFITPLDDDDLEVLVNEALAGSACALGGLLHQRFKALTN